MVTAENAADIFGQGAPLRNEFLYFRETAGLTFTDIGATLLYSASPLGKMRRKSRARARILVLGGGAGGICVAAHLMRSVEDPDVTILEPSAWHIYQPGQTLIGGGVFARQDVLREERPLIPPGVKWVQDAASEIDPQRNTVTTSSGATLSYDYLVVATGLQMHFDAIAGLGDHLGRGGICSIYTLDQAVATWNTITNFRGKEAIFTFPATPIKCGGAPQKIMYMMDDYLRLTGSRHGVNITYAAPGEKIFGVPAYAEALSKVADRKDIIRKFCHKLVEVRPDRKEAVFVVTKKTNGCEPSVQEERVVMPYDLLHVVPPMSAPAWLKEGPLCHADGPDAGWLKVDRHTLQHLDYPNIFGIGDVMGIASNKTSAAVRKEAPILARNLIAAMEGRDPATSFSRYNGYTACPIITGYGKLIMAEFDYAGQPIPSFPVDSTKERYSMWLVKVYVLPALYWRGMMKGLCCWKNVYL